MNPSLVILLLALSNSAFLRPNMLIH